MRDYYAILDLPSTATVEQVDARYRQFIRMFDPALYTEPAELAYVRKKLTAIEEAYQALRSGQTHERIESGITTRSTSTVQHRPIDFISGEGSRKHAASLVRKSRVRWLHKFLLTSTTILVAALVGTAALEQGLGVWAYVVALQQGKSSLSEAVQPGSAFISQKLSGDAVTVSSPNQQQSALVASVLGNKQSFLQGTANGQTVPLPQASGLQSHALWSSRGDKLAFLDESATGPQIHIFELATKRLYTFQPPSALGQLGRIGWSADSSFLLFEAQEGKVAGQVTLWRIDSTGQNLTPLLKPAPLDINWSQALP